MLAETWNYFLEVDNWAGPAGLAARSREHLALTAVVMLIAASIAVPAGLLIGHTGRGRNAVMGTSGALRSLPSLGLLTILALWVPGGVANALIPSVIVLVLLAIPPILAGAYSGVDAIAPGIPQAARAIGHTEWQILSRVEIPLSTAGVLDGLRSATLQVIATATLCSYLGLGGLGRYVLDGLATRDYPMVLVGAIAVILLALLVEGVLAAVTALVTRKADPSLAR